MQSFCQNFCLIKYNQKFMYGKPREESDASIFSHGNKHETYWLIKKPVQSSIFKRSSHVHWFVKLSNYLGSKMWAVLFSPITSKPEIQKFVMQTIAISYRHLGIFTLMRCMILKLLLLRQSLLWPEYYFLKIIFLSSHNLNITQQ